MRNFSCGPSTLAALCRNDSLRPAKVIRSKLRQLRSGHSSLHPSCTTHWYSHRNFSRIFVDCVVLYIQWRSPTRPLLAVSCQAPHGSYHCTVWSGSCLFASSSQSIIHPWSSVFKLVFFCLIIWSSISPSCCCNPKISEELEGCLKSFFLANTDMLCPDICTI